MRCVTVLVATLFLNACASIDVTAPKKYDIDNSRVYPLSFEEVWAHAVDWFAGQNVIIDTLQKPSGLITAQYRIEDRDQVADCGDIRVSKTIYKGGIDKSGSLNVTIRSLNENKTRVNIYFFSDYKVQVQEIWAERTLSKSGSCESTGKLEKSIFEYIAN